MEHLALQQSEHVFPVAGSSPSSQRFGFGPLVGDGVFGRCTIRSIFVSPGAGKRRRPPQLPVGRLLVDHPETLGAEVYVEYALRVGDVGIVKLGIWRKRSRSRDEVRVIVVIANELEWYRINEAAKTVHCFRSERND